MDFISTLPGELIARILYHLRPIGPLTTYESTAASPDLCGNHVESRTSFSNLCRVSKSFHHAATGYLYRTVVLRDQTELLFFFRTLASDPGLRSMVYSFAWVGVLSSDGIDIELVTRREAEAASLALDCWASMHWPSDPADFRIAQLMGIDGPNTLQSWRVLGAVLAMVSGLRSLFIVHGCGVNAPGEPTNYPPCPEQDALWKLIGVDIKVSSPCQFLQKLETITLEPHHNPRTEDSVIEETLIGLLVSLPLLRRIELKGIAHFQGTMDIIRQLQAPNPLIGSVQELLHFRALDPQVDMMDLVAAFPKLISLQAEYIDGSIRTENTTGQLSQALLAISTTLSTLSLTTALGKTWIDPDILPLLSTLNQMTRLNHLTTESVWLFGRQDPSIALQLPHLLPSSLISFHLIDFWGTCDTETFYPELPYNWTPLEFYSQIFLALHGECLSRFPGLREVMVTPRHSSFYPMIAMNGHGHDQLADGHAFLLRFQHLFESIGVRFSIGTPELVRTRLHSSWANMD